MKKLVFLFAMVFAVGMVMAQKNTNLYQSGNYNSATVTQASFQADNTIFASQSGDGNTLSTFQLGWDNDLELHQGGNYNSAEMVQLTLDVDEIYGNNNAEVYQQGDENTASVTQQEINPTDMGDGGEWVWVPNWLFPWIGEYEFFPNPEEDRSVNVATAQQIGNSNSYSLNQGRQAHRPDNESFLIQSGNYNTADISQLGVVNYSEIRQTGDGNEAGLLQTGDDHPSISWTNNTSLSWQAGDYNELSVLQVGEVDEHSAESSQSGNENNTVITQVGDILQNVDAYQSGNSNDVTITQVDVQ